MLGFNRRRIIQLFATVVAIVAVASFALRYLIPAAPSTVVFAAGLKGSTFHHDGTRYQDVFARSHVKLELRETHGAVENLKLLQDPNSGVQAGVVIGGISDAKNAPDLLSLGLVYDNAFWIFSRSSEPLENLSQLKGKRIAVGPPGSGTRFAAERILGRAGIDSTNTTLTELRGPPAHAALKNGTIDAAWVNGGPRAGNVQLMLRDPALRLVSFPMAEAFTRMFPDVVQLTLPKGVINVDPPIPNSDITLIGTTNKVLVRSDLHPEIVYLLLKAMKEVHGEHGIFQKVGEFPKAEDPEYPMAASALEFYKNGPSFLQRHLPSWMIVQVERAIAVLVTVIAVGVPLFNYLPKLYRSLVEVRLRSIYRRLRAIELTLQNGLAPSEVPKLEAALAQLDREINKLQVPIRHSDMFFRLKSDIHLVRISLGSLRKKWPRQVA